MKRLTKENQPTPPNRKKQRVAYTAPAVIYEGIITTRAGTVIGSDPNDANVDPADLFGN